MAATTGSLQQTSQSQTLFHALDPMSLILAQNSGPYQPVPLKLTTESYVMERGPRYRAYAELRESKLRMKNARQQESEEVELKQTPPKKQVRFTTNSGTSRRGPSALAQSVPDFSSALRKENRKPATTTQELTPPSKNWSKANGVLSNSRGSKSANAGEKKGLSMARKSYASLEELKGIASTAANAINGENRGGRSSRGIGSNKTVLGYRQF